LALRRFCPSTTRRLADATIRPVRHVYLFGNIWGGM
jgi:hypothetical protein